MTCVCGHGQGSHDRTVGYCRAQRAGRNPCGCRSFAADANANRTPVCSRPPEGWTCSRTAGHEGPCAASPDGCGRNGTSDEVEDLPHSAAPARPAPDSEVQLFATAAEAHAALATPESAP
jgi:hypothetical protein